MFDKKIKTIIEIEGMACDSCARRVKTSLLEIEGIKSISVNLTNGQVEIISNQKIAHDKIEKTISNLGYKLINIID